MGRKLLGYRVRGTCEFGFAYAIESEGPRGIVWTGKVPSPFDWQRFHAKAFAKEAAKDPIDAEGNGIEVSDVKIVAVYLKTNDYKSSFAREQAREDLSSFNRSVLDEIDRRKIDAIVEPEDIRGMPTTLRFRAPNGCWIWIPIIACSVVDGPKETRASRTVDRMLETIRSLAGPIQCEYDESGFCGQCEICAAAMKQVQRTKGFVDRALPKVTPEQARDIELHTAEMVRLGAVEAPEGDER